MNLKVIHPDSEILGGTPFFSGTRVPIETLFDHLEDGVSLDEFLEDFPTVEKEQAITLLKIAGKFVILSNCMNLLLDENLPEQMQL